MKAIEVNKEIIGKRCKSIFTGMMVAGTIEDIEIDKYTANVKVRFDEPHQWGECLYKYDWSFARLDDDFGSLRHLEIIDDGYQAVRITFEKEISEINKMFVREYHKWQAVNLKEWVDSYESTRFTQIGGRTVIITSEYNMEHVLEWLNRNMQVLNIQKV